MYKDLYFSIRNCLMDCLDFIEQNFHEPEHTFET